MSNGCCILNVPKQVTGGAVKRKSEPKRATATPKSVKKKRKVDVGVSDASTDLEELGDPEIEETERKLRVRRSSCGTPVTIPNMDRIEKENSDALQKVAVLKEKLKYVKEGTRIDQSKISSLEKELARVKRAYSAVAPGRATMSRR